MKPDKLLLLLLSCVLLPIAARSQDITLNKYRFGEGLTFTSPDDDYKMEITGYVQPYMESRKYLDNQDPAFYNRYRLRRARLIIGGTSAKERLTYRLQLDLAGAGEGDDEFGSLLYDAFVGYDITDNINISFGQKSTPTDNRELNMRSNTLQLVERSPITSAFGSIREFGLFAEASYKVSANSYLRPEIAVTNGDGANVFGRDHGGFKYGGRIDYLPFGLFTNFGQNRQADIVHELTPKLVFGVTYSYNNGISDRRGRDSGSIIYLNDKNEEELPDYIKFGVDFLFKYRGFSLLGEYVKATGKVPDGLTQRVREDGSTSASFLVNGIEDIDSYVKGRMMVGQGYNLQGGYMFKNFVSIDGRFSHLQPDKNSFLNNGAFYNRSNYYTLGISKYLDRNYGAKIQFDVTYINAKAGSQDINGNIIAGDELLGRLIMTISF